MLCGTISNMRTFENLFLRFDRADILRENAEALFAACDAAHGRWAKIVGIRSQIHPKLKLQEFLGVYNISQEFISSTEKVCATSYGFMQSMKETCVLLWCDTILC